MLTEETRELFGYALFDDVDDKDLQAYNRAIAMRNISADMGDNAVKEYFGMIPHSEQLYTIIKMAEVAGFQ